MDAAFYNYSTNPLANRIIGNHPTGVGGQDGLEHAMLAYTV